MRRRYSDDEIEALGGEPATGEIWWCEGAPLNLTDGGKTRPVLVVSTWGDRVSVIPLTSNKPGSGAVAVAHRAGHSWLTHREISVARLSLLSLIGPWNGYREWKAKNPTW